jgi:hypothetical protein
MANPTSAGFKLALLEAISIGIVRTFTYSSMEVKSFDFYPTAVYPVLSGDCVLGPSYATRNFAYPNIFILPRQPFSNKKPDSFF